MFGKVSVIKISLKNQKVKDFICGSLLRTKTSWFRHIFTHYCPVPLISAAAYWVYVPVNSKSSGAAFEVTWKRSISAVVPVQNEASLNSDRRRKKSKNDEWLSAFSRAPHPTSSCCIDVCRCSGDHFGVLIKPCMHIRYIFKETELLVLTECVSFFFPVYLVFWYFVALF